MSNEETLALFKRYAGLASYHYADDSTKEWGSAKQAKAVALALFDYHSGLQKEMREIAAEQLWAAEFREARP